MYHNHIHVPYSWKFLLDNIFDLEMFADLIFVKRQIFMCALNRRINLHGFEFADVRKLDTLEKKRLYGTYMYMYMYIYTCIYNVYMCVCIYVHVILHV